jgi:riboflavin kinase/FMN adenylyltransferase
MENAASIQELHERSGVRDAVLACGVFDGVHRGHQQIIRSLLEQSHETAATPIVLTFDPHPRAVLQPDRAPRPLTPRDHKLRVLDRLGVEATVFLRFSREMAALPPEAFVREHLLSPDVKVHGICVGAPWRFGAKGQGDTALLDRVGQQEGFRVVSVPEFRLYGLPVSSTRIREAIAGGRLRFAAQMLGRPFAVSGRVARGRGLGARELGCPTANLTGPSVVLPPTGVYAARGRLATRRAGCLEGIAYVGDAPSVPAAAADAETRPLLEMHIFDFTGDLYGKRLDVELLERIRPDRTFPTLCALRDQIREDIGKARRILADST